VSFRGKSCDPAPLSKELRVIHHEDGIDALFVHSGEGIVEVDGIPDLLDLQLPTQGPSRLF
jgi:hypothetical protein